MRNKSIILTLFTLMTMLAACGTAKKAVTVPDTTTTTPGTTTTTAATDPYDAVIATLGNWQTMQCGGNIKLSAGSSFSSAIQMRMVRDEAIYISVRPMLGIEVGKIIITADSLYAIDKVHKRYIAEKVSILTSGIPVTVSDVQDIFLGRPFIIGQGSLSAELKPQVATTREGNNIVIAPSESYKGYGYGFTFDKSNRITSLDIVPAGSTTAAYQVKYSDVRGTVTGNIAHGLNATATVEKKKLALTLTFKNIDWNGNIKIDRNIPNGYSRMSAKSLLSIFSN